MQWILKIFLNFLAYFFHHLCETISPRRKTFFSFIKPNYILKVQKLLTALVRCTAVIPATQEAEIEGSRLEASLGIVSVRPYLWMWLKWYSACLVRARLSSNPNTANIKI
jgi:hypothetical protein